MIDGVLAINGDYTQTSSGELDIHLYGASANDMLQVSGLATLDGTLRVYGMNGYAPAPGAVFVVVTYGSRSGVFSDLILPSTSYGGTWDPRYDDPNFPHALSLWVVGGSGYGGGYRP
jgi:hypothetical protein